MKIKIFSLVLIAILAVSAIGSVSANDGSNNLIDAQNVGTITYHIEAKFYDANNKYLRCDYRSNDLTGANRKWFHKLELKYVPANTKYVDVTIVSLDGFLNPEWQVSLENRNVLDLYHTSFRMDIDQRLDIYTTYRWTGGYAGTNKLTVRQMT